MVNLFGMVFLSLIMVFLLMFMMWCSIWLITEYWKAIIIIGGIIIIADLLPKRGEVK